MQSDGFLPGGIPWILYKSRMINLCIECLSYSLRRLWGSHSDRSDWVNYPIRFWLQKAASTLHPLTCSERFRWIPWFLLRSGTEIKWIHSQYWCCSIRKNYTKKNPIPAPQWMLSFVYDKLQSTMFLFAQFIRNIVSIDRMSLHATVILGRRALNVNLLVTFAVTPGDLTVIMLDAQTVERIHLKS